jgi:inhibitor of the pro-sigma K processing machinery
MLLTVLPVILAFGGGLLILFILAKVLKISLKIIWKLIINALIGAAILVLFNLVGGIFSFSIPITPLNALITGFLGVPGVILLIILQFIL